MTARAPEQPAPEYFCGCCAARGWVWCQACVGGCQECRGVGQIMCPDCQGNGANVSPPDWV